MRVWLNAILLLPALILSNVAVAQSTSSSAASNPQALSTTVAPIPPLDFSASLFSMVKGLAICVALLLTVVWLLKKFKAPLVTGQGRAMRIVERLPVTTKSSLLLVEVNSKKVLIGVGSDPISLVSDFVDSDAMDSGPAGEKIP